MRRFLFLGAVLAIGACKGLLLDNGNNYPCDFSEGPGKRDEVCQPGDICGTNNLCQKFIYEGPRFEGTATLPVYGPGSGEGELLHPLVLKEPVTAISADLPVLLNSKVFVQQGEDTLQVRKGRVSPNLVVLPSALPVGFGMLATGQTFHDGPAGPANVLLRSATGRLAVGTLGLANTDAVRAAGSLVPATVEGSRVIELSVATNSMPIAWGDGGVGVVQKRTPGQGWEYQPWVTGGPKVFDVAALTLPGKLWLFTLEADGLEVIDSRDGGIMSRAADLDRLAAVAGSLKTDQASRVIAAVRTGTTPVLADVLSTFQVNVTADGPVLSSPWPDCRPCDFTEHVELEAPSVRSGFPTVDVVCAPNDVPGGGASRRQRSALRVFGSVALTQLDACLSEEINPAVALSRVQTTDAGTLVHWDNQWGLLVGGKHGEVWSGETLTDLEPEFLDRVPLDVAPANTGVTPALAVIADDYLAVQQNLENSEDGGEQLNGFRRVPLNELGVAENSRLFGFVHGVSGWAVDNTGMLVRANLARNLPQNLSRVQTGPRLVTASEELIRDSIGGEAFTETDGGPIGFILAADDSLYFVQDPEAYLGPENEGLLLVPDLTPEPSVPIRSLALERTPLGTDGVERARGYLVTSRSVYSWALDGAPSRWSSTQLPLSFGEPAEVWFDSTRSALGRVGYRDGQIYSLPGGYPLAEALPEGADGEAPLVLDYENLGGWPVAYATTGLFIAGWDLSVDGKLQNRFPNGVNKPMTWRELKLPDGSTPWTRLQSTAGGPRQRHTKAGKLFVAVDPLTPDGQLYRLLLFNDDEVRQVAHHLRK